MATADDGNFVTVELQGECTAGPSAEALALQAAVAEVADFRAKLKGLGEPPDHETVDEARFALSAIDAALASDLENFRASEDSSEQAQREKEVHEAAEVAKSQYQAIIDTYNMHYSYEVLLKAAELTMMKLSGVPEIQLPILSDTEIPEDQHTNEEVTRTLLAAKEGDIVNVKLSGCKLTCLPDAFGNVSTIASLELSNNELKLLPDSLGGLAELHTLNVEHNNLVTLPDSIGLLKKLKVLNISRNKLTYLPDSISVCSGLEILNADLNELAYLPSQIGLGLPNLNQLSLRWNKLRSLPASICNLRSLRRLELKFNHLKALPEAIGNLTNLEYLDVSCNFTFLQALPDTVGDLVALAEIDLSCNQIKCLPESFGRVPALKKINLKDNPLVSPPLEVAEAGCEAVMDFMKEKWQNFLEEEKQRQLTEDSQQQDKWIPWALGGLSKILLGGSPRSPKKASSTDDYLEQQL